PVVARRSGRDRGRRTRPHRRARTSRRSGHRREQSVLQASSGRTMNGDERTQNISSWWIGWRITRFLPKRYLLGGFLWVVVIAFPVLTGLVLRALFDRFT